MKIRNDLNLYNINGLSEQFVYFNDDTFIIDNVIPDDFEKWCAEFAPAVYADYSLEEKWNILQDIYNK